MNKNNENIRIDDISRLKWACRRGMLELDVLLSNFLAEAYPSLSSVEKEAFIRLLAAPDPDLFAWLMAKEKNTDATLQMIVERVREHATKRF